jgi:O-antigen/teichoic acid export membrane protein
VAQPAPAARLAVTAIAGQGIAYLLALLLARRLGVAGFEAYAVSGAVFVLMATFAPRGIEKYALRALPALLERADWAGARGFLRFGLRRTLATALLVGAGVAAWAAWLADLSDATRWAIVVSCAALPAGALVHYGLEVLSATGREVRALTLYRVATPALALLFVGVLLALAVDLSGAIAAACWGVAWVGVLGLMALEARRALPPAVLRAAPAEDAPLWQAEARPFFVYRLSLALLGHTGVLALDALQPSAAAVGAYAVAMGTVSLAAVLATATNRAYARRLSILLERRDFASLQALRRERLRWLLPAVAVFLVLSFAFTRELLALFRPEFAEVGVLPLRVLAMSTAFTVLLSLAPTYLKFRQRNRSTYAAVGSAAAAQGLLLLWLVPVHGATGAALAYAISMCGMYGAFAWMAHRELRQFKR